MLPAIIFLNLQLFERFISIDIGFIEIGPGEIFIFLYLTYNFLLKKEIKIYREFLILSILFALCILISLISNSAIYGINSLVNIAIKIIFVGIVCSNFSNKKIHPLYPPLINFNIFLYVVFLIFLSGLYSAPELFNRNELILYASALLAIKAVASYKTNTFRKDSLLPYYFSTVFILFSLAIIGQSRQAILAGIFMAVSIYIVSSKTLLQLLTKSFVAVALVISFSFLVINLELDGKQAARLKTITNLEPANRADMHRLNNIIQGYEGFVEKPFFGHGSTSFKRNNLYGKVAHNTYISTAYELGIVGIMILLSVFARMIKTLFIKSNDRNFQNSSVMIGGLVVFFIVQIAFIETLAKAPLYVFLLITFLFLRLSKGKFYEIKT